ncbi:hypothetical protein CsSME_00041976 [Camellia sinensis var. sinensis]
MFLDQTLLFRSTIGLLADKWSYCGDLLEGCKDADLPCSNAYSGAVGFGQTMAAVMWNAYDLNKFGCSLGGSVFLFAHNSIPHAHCSIFRNYSSRGFYNEEIYSIQPIYETQYLCWKDCANLMFAAQTMDYQLEAVEQFAD